MGIRLIITNFRNMKKKIQKPFDVEAAKNGAIIETRNGHSVRILCYDKVSDNYPIVALVNSEGRESCHSYTLNGEAFASNSSESNLVIVEEVECPKFQVGAFIVINGDVYEVSYIDNTNNLYHFQNVKSGFSQKLPIKNIDNVYNHWNNNDAKPGDILIDCYNKPFIFKGYIDKEHPGCPVAYCGINYNDEFESDTDQNWWTDSSVRPATYKEKQQFFNRLEEEDYKWDDSLTLSKIQKRWRDEEDTEVNDYYIHSDSHIVKHSSYNSDINYNIFATEKQAKSALAMAQISQIMANDERFGGIVTDEEWCDNVPCYYVILKVRNILVITTSYRYEYLGFHTMEQANLFLEENEDLIKDYYMLD